MPLQVVNGAMLKCALAVPPGTTTLIVPPRHRVMSGNQPAANITDCIPMTNIPPFGMCMTQTNPAVAAATTAAGGTPTPAPCVPVIVGLWTPGSATVPLDFLPALNNTSTCQCAWGGVVTVVNPGQATEMIP